MEMRGNPYYAPPFESLGGLSPYADIPVNPPANR